MSYTTTITATTYTASWTFSVAEPNSIDDCKTLSELRAWSKRQRERRMHEYRTSVYPWMSDYAHLLGCVELHARAITIEPEEEWRKNHKRYAKLGWFPACVTSYSRRERFAITRKLMSMGPSYVSRAYRCEDKYAIVHLVNDPELTIFFKEMRDRAMFIEWASRFERPVLLSTKKDTIPIEAQRLLRGLNHYVLRGSNGTVISCEIIHDDLARQIQSHL